MKKFIYSIAVSALFFSACNTKNDYEAVFSNPLLYSHVTNQLTEVIT
jgi:hypothetical protein